MLLVVAESTGSSPGRQGYKMTVGSDGELFGSIGGGVMEVNLVEESRAILSEPPAVAGDLTRQIRTQVHKKNTPNSSGMICSGKQTVIFRKLTSTDARTVESIVESIRKRSDAFMTLSSRNLSVGPPEGETPNEDFHFEKIDETDFRYIEKLGPKSKLYLIGGGHCALALSELMSKMNFHISIFDDRPDLNTIGKNRFADEITIIDNYEQIGELILEGSNVYVVVMTLGYNSDEIVIRALLDIDIKYFGVLGSKAKMKILLTALAKDGFSKERISRIRTPVGLAINSRTPEEIAVSIAAQIIAVKNA